MAHYAKIENGIVEQVIVVNNEVLLDDNNVEQELLGLSFIHNLYNDNTTIWVQTSYNTYGNEHPLDMPLRGNYAGVGYTYDEVKDAFYAPQPYPSWTLNEDTCQWEAPTPYPDDGEHYKWNEETLSWENE